MTHNKLGNSSNYLNFNIIVSDYFNIIIIIMYILLNTLLISKYYISKYLNILIICDIGRDSITGISMARGSSR